LDSHLGSLEGGTHLAGAAAVAHRSRRALANSTSAPSLPPNRSPSPPADEFSPTPPAQPAPVLLPSRQAAASEDGGDVDKILDKVLLSSRSAPLASPPGSANSTPRTPRCVEVTVEGQELAVPPAQWLLPERAIVAPAGSVVCSATVKAGLSGKSGVHVVLRVGLAALEENLRFDLSSAASFDGWVVTRVTGTAECDIGRLPSRGSSPRVPQPGECQHIWSDTSQGGGSSSSSSSSSSQSPTGVSGQEAVPTIQEALTFGSSGCAVDFKSRLELRVHASCVVQSSGNATLRVEAEGELQLRPQLRAIGRLTATRLYGKASAAFCAGEDLKAIQTCEEALMKLDGLKPPPRELGDVLNLLGALHLRRGSLALAIRCLQHAVALRSEEASTLVSVGRELLPKASCTLAATLSTLGKAQQLAGAHVEALHCQLRAAALLEASLGPNDAALATALHGLGGAHSALGQHEEALQCFERALGIREKVLGEHHPLRASSLNNLGAALQRLGHHRKAVSYYQRALAVERRAYGGLHPTTAATLSNLGTVHQHLGDHRCAIACHSCALAIQEKALGPEHLSIATTLHNLGNALASAGRGLDAARCHWRALAVWCRGVGPAHPDVAATLHSLGNVYRGLFDSEAAGRCFAGALRIREAALGPTHPETARTRHCAALVGCVAGDQPTALHDLQATVHALQASLGAKHPWCMQALADAEFLKQTLAASC